MTGGVDLPLLPRPGTLLFARIAIPNAICFAPDGRLACFADTALALA